MGIVPFSSWGGKACAMRMEAKVYMSHTDMYRIQEAAKRSGETLSGFMRRVTLQAADALEVPRYQTVLEGQRGLLELARIGGE